MSAPAAKVNLVIQQGASFSKRLTWKDARKRPIDLTGFSALLHVKDKVGGQTLLEMSTANGRITLAAGGVITLNLTPAQTEALGFTAAVYDMKMIQGGEEMRLIEGRVNVSPAVTLRGA